jgi:aminopeptidase
LQLNLNESRLVFSFEFQKEDLGDEMDKKQLQNYAKVILELGVNLKPGKNLIINAEVIHWEFVNLLSDEAYKMGAQLVRVETRHPYLQKSRLLYSEEKYLEYIPSYLEKEMSSFIDENWSIVHIGGEEDPDLMKDVDPDRSAVIRKANGMARRPMISAQMSGKCPWVIAALPTPAWAAKVFACEPSEEASSKLWDVMVPILRLDQPDPVKAWRDHSNALKARIKILDDAKIDFVHFKGLKTDLKIHLAKNAIWEGGASESYCGGDYLPNIPTEEIFAVPDYRRVNGRVSVTRPVQVL